MSSQIMANRVSVTTLFWFETDLATLSRVVVVKRQKRTPTRVNKDIRGADPLRIGRSRTSGFLRRLNSREAVTHCRLIHCSCLNLHPHAVGYAIVRTIRSGRPLVEW